MIHPLKSLVSMGAVGMPGADQPASDGNNPFIKNQAEAALFARLSQEFPSLIKEYSNLPDTEGGKILNTDIARELSPEYREDRTRAAEIHEPASKFTKSLYLHKLAQSTPENHEPRVLFTAGGAGAGKSTALENVKALSSKAKRSEMIYDTNMDKLDSAEQKIQQALDAKRKAMIMYTYRDPVDALVNGALKRANSMEKKHGSGRTVPLSTHLKTHVGARETIQALHEKYRDHPDVEIRAIDNSRGLGKARQIAIEKLPKINPQQLRKELHDALEQEYASGKISHAIYKGTKDYST
jgi:hypothetical protein